MSRKRKDRVDARRAEATIRNDQYRQLPLQEKLHRSIGRKHHNRLILQSVIASSCMFGRILQAMGHR